ncbi:MAG: hypothetical protein AAF969_08690 [Bacteroidota bacterium]
MRFNLDRVQMRVIQTAANGVVNHETLFQFSQKENLVYATYAGGQIQMGFLVGSLQESALHFSYCQLQIDGKLDNGMSKAELSHGPENKIRLTEHFEWKSRPGETGTNIFEQC